MPNVIGKIVPAGDFKIADADEIAADNFGDMSVMDDFLYGEFWGSSRDLGSDDIQQATSDASSLAADINIPASAPNSFFIFSVTAPSASAGNETFLSSVFLGKAEVPTTGNPMTDANSVTFNGNDGTVYRFGRRSGKLEFSADSIGTYTVSVTLIEPKVNEDALPITELNARYGQTVIDGRINTLRPNPFTVTYKNKLDSIENGATADQTPAEIVLGLEGLSGNNRLQASAIRNLPSGGSGLDQSAVDARVKAGVYDWSEQDNKDLIPITKLPDKLQELDGGITGDGWNQDIANTGLSDMLQATAPTSIPQTLTYTRTTFDQGPRQTNYWVVSRILKTDRVNAALYRVRVHTATGAFVHEILLSNSTHVADGTRWSYYASQFADIPSGAAVTIEHFNPLELDANKIHIINQRHIINLQDAIGAGLSDTGAGFPKTVAGAPVAFSGNEIDLTEYTHGFAHYDITMHIITRSANDVGFDSAGLTSVINNGSFALSDVIAASAYDGSTPSTFEGVELFSQDVYKGSTVIRRIVWYAVKTSDNKLRYYYVDNFVTDTASTFAFQTKIVAVLIPNDSIARSDVPAAARVSPREIECALTVASRPIEFSGDVVCGLASPTVTAGTTFGSVNSNVLTLPDAGVYDFYFDVDITNGATGGGGRPTPQIKVERQHSGESSWDVVLQSMLYVKNPDQGRSPIEISGSRRIVVTSNDMFRVQWNAYRQSDGTTGNESLAGKLVVLREF